MTDAITFNTVTKRFGDCVALDQFTLRVPAGELYGLIGPNGAGKSTAIKLMVGLLRVTSGSLTVLGHAPADRSLRAQIGYMPQETALYFDLTIRENLDLFGRLYGLNSRERISRILEVLRFVDLERWANTIVMNLSGGMQHRASLAVALLTKPKLLVLDEPTVGIDPELRASFWQQFAAMRAAGTTILLTTHYLDEAMHCGTVGLVNHGQLVAEGSPNKLMRQSQTKTLEAAFLKLAGRSTVQHQRHP